MTTPTPGQPLSEADVSLLPCPFCGGEAWLNDYEAKYSDLPPTSRAPQCRSCGASLGYLTTPAKAIAAWNRRPHAPVSRPGDGVEGERDSTALTSIAESLKRIADLLDGTTAGICVTETLLGGRRID